MKNRINSGTLILKELSKKELTRTEIRQIAFDNRTNKSAYSKGSKYYKSSSRYQNVKKVPHGWFGNGVGDLENNGMINYNKDDNNYTITETGILNINKPYTKKPILNHKDYTSKIKNLKEQMYEYWNKSSKLTWTNSKLAKENEQLENENEILKSELEKYKQTEEIDYLDRLINDDDYIDSYGEDVLIRIKAKLTK